MKDEQPLQSEPNNQSIPAESFNTFGNNDKSTESFASSAPVSSVQPLAASEVEPPTSSLQSAPQAFAPATPAAFSESDSLSSSLEAPVTSNAGSNDFISEQPSASGTETPFMTEPVLPVSIQPFESPAVTTAPVFGGIPTPPKKSKRKKIIIIGALIGVFALLGGTGAAAYNLWYQNPDKVLGDALVNALKAKTVTYTGSFDIDYKGAGASAEDTRFSVKVDGKNIGNAGEVNVAVEATFEGEEYKVSGSGLIDKDANLFVKVNDVKKLLQSLPDESGTSYDQLPSYITAIVDKVDSKWIRISADDIREFSDDYADKQTCTEDAFKKLQDDKELSNELLQVYKDNKFIVIDEKLAAKNGSLGYVIDVDTNKSNDFAKAADKTKFAKELQKCDKNFKFSSNSSSSNSSSNDDSDTKTRVEVWVDRWSHQLTKMSFTAEDDEADGSFVFEPTFNQSVSVEAPKDFIPLKDLKKDIEDAYTQYMTSALGDYDTIRREAVINTYKSNNQGKEPTEAEIQLLLQGDSLSAERTL